MNLIKTLHLNRNKWEEFMVLLDDYNLASRCELAEANECAQAVAEAATRLFNTKCTLVNCGCELDD